jgi:hypothetical protein
MPEEVLVEDFPAGDKGSRIVELEVSADEEASSPDVDVAMTGAPVSRVQQKCGKLKCCIGSQFLSGRQRSVSEARRSLRWPHAGLRPVSSYCVYRTGTCEGGCR